LVADGTPIRAVEFSNGTYRFVVPRNARSVALDACTGGPRGPTPSRNAGDHPTGVHPDGVLPAGLNVAEIAIRSAEGDIVIPADDPRLTEGWNDPQRLGQRIWRATSGIAQIPWNNAAGPAVVTIRCTPSADATIREAEPESQPAIQFPDSAQWQGGLESELLVNGTAPDLALSGPVSTDETFAAEPLSAALETWQWRRQPQVPVMISGDASDAPSAGLLAPVRIQWCLGMYSSGSTWAFNAIRSIGNILFPGRPHAGVYAETVGQLPPDWMESDRLIIKSHHSDNETTTLLLRHADRLWISVRDPRDSVASAMTYMFPDFASALNAVVRSAEYCERFIQDPRCVLLRYEDGFIDDPATLDQFAAAWSRTLEPRERDRLFQESRRAAIEAMIQKFDPTETVDDGYRGHRVHMRTQWHTHHLNRTGEVGRWHHTLNESQVNEIKLRLGSWMEQFGYAS
jgi:hypothetical protein